MGPAAALCLLAGLAMPVLDTSGPPPILIGVSNAQSGASGMLGKLLTAGSMAYFDLVNESGGIHGHKIQVILEDDRYEPEPAIENTYDLIRRRNVLFLFDYVGTPTLTRVLPLLKYYQAETIVNVAPFTGAEPQRIPPYDRFVFNIRASYRDETRALVEYLYSRGFRKIGFLGQADAYGKSGEIGVIEALSAQGLKLAGIATYRRNQGFDASMREQVDILRKAGADAVIAVGVYGACSGFIRDARVGGWDVPIANVSFVGAKILLDQLKEYSPKIHRDLTLNLVNSETVPTPNETKYPLVASFREHVTADRRTFIGLEGWLNAVVTVEALKRMGPGQTRADFAHAMESLGHWDPGLRVELGFSAVNHQGLHRVWITRTEGGRWEPADGP